MQKDLKQQENKNTHTGKKSQKDAAPGISIEKDSASAN